MAGRVEPYLDSAALYQWTQCAMEALGTKDMEALRCRLPALLQASDERVLQALAPSCEAHGVGSLLGAQRQAPEVEAEAPLSLAQEPEVDEQAEAPLSSLQPLEVGPSAPEPMPAGGPGALRTNWSGLQTSLRQVPPEGARPVPAPPELRSTPSMGVPEPQGGARESVRGY